MHKQLGCLSWVLDGKYAFEGLCGQSLMISLADAFCLEIGDA